MFRHHYSVARQGDGQPERRFHTFEEADASFSELVSSAGEEGLTAAGESYWRRRFSGPGGRDVTLALDDRGLAPCDARCGAG